MSKILIFVVAIAVLFVLLKNKLGGGARPVEEKDKKAIDTTNMVKDPICGTYIEETTPYKVKYYGKVYYFDSEECLEKFKSQKKQEMAENE